MPDHTISAGRLRPLAEPDLELVRSWRNHPAIREFMYNRHVIDAAEHRRWFEACSHDPARHLLVYEETDLPRGFVSFTYTRTHGVVEWGFYCSPHAPHGTGQRLGTTALLHAFTGLHLHKICGEALAFNERSIRFHEKLGFTREGVLRDQHFDGERYHDVIRFGLLAPEYLSAD